MEILRRLLESTQYTSEQFQRLMADNGVTKSEMGLGRVETPSEG
jgi:hypothetical protein